jgi:hypothetical protein
MNDMTRARVAEIIKDCADNIKSASPAAAIIMLWLSCAVSLKVERTMKAALKEGWTDRLDQLLTIQERREHNAPSENMKLLSEHEGTPH